MDQALRAVGVTKRYGPILANDNIAVPFSAGQIHALLGENGAGKSTLAKILAGIVQPDAGTVHLDGRQLELRRPRDAINAGIGMIQQHPALIPELTLAENCMFGATLNSGGMLLDHAMVERELTELARQLEFEPIPAVPAGELSLGQRQRGEILRLLRRAARVLILDEPTDVLTPQEASLLFRALRTLAEEGATVIFITHRLAEVFEASDDVTVLRDGALVGRAPTSVVVERQLVEWVVGRPYTPAKRQRREVVETSAVLSTSAIRASGSVPLRDISLDVGAGEILGIAGVEGNGQEQLADVLAGIQRPSSGRITMLGHDISNALLGERYERGLAYIPSDRHRAGLALELTVLENLCLRFLTGVSLRSVSAWRLPWRRLRREAAVLIQGYGIRCRSLDQPMRELSGGNQQKVVLARELSRQPDVIIASQPTRGLDLGARDFVHAQLAAQARRGAAVVLLSSDLDEIVQLADRVAVMVRGGIQGEVQGHQLDARVIGRLMTSSALEEHPVG